MKLTDKEKSAHTRRLEKLNFSEISARYHTAMRNYTREAHHIGRKPDHAKIERTSDILDTTYAVFETHTKQQVAA